VLTSAAVLSPRHAWIFALLLVLAACRPELPDPPDPNRPIAPTTCEEQPLLGFDSLEPDSALSTPPWLAACSTCPVGALDLRWTDPALDRVAAWTEPSRCAAALPTQPWASDLESATAQASLQLDDAAGTVTLDVPLAGNRGENPADFDVATFRLALDRDQLAEPAGNVPLGGRTVGQADLLLELAPTEDPDRLSARVGLTLPGSTEQDLCAPTHDLGDWVLSERQLATELLDGDVLPVPLGGAVRRGALQGRLSSSGAALQNLVLLAVFDAARLADETGQAPDAFCAEWEDVLGRPFCSACGDPADGAQGLPTCYTLVWEWSLASATAGPLTPVDPSDLPPDCVDAAE
jgi:hypothetical protein